MDDKVQQRLFDTKKSWSSSLITVRRRENARYFYQKWFRFYWPLHLACVTMAMCFAIKCLRTRQKFGPDHPLTIWEYNRQKREGSLHPESIKLEQASFKNTRILAPFLVDSDRLENWCREKWSSIFNTPSKAE